MPHTSSTVMSRFVPRHIRPKRGVAGVASGLTLAALLFGVGAAHAQSKPSAAETKQQCIAAYEATQSLREAGKLVEAREQAIVCARSECPKALNSECIVWVGEIEKSTPTVVFTAKAPDGKDITTVKVTVDGKLVSEELGARAVPLDPGKRTFRFDSADHGSKELEIVLREGEKNRTVAVSFDAPSVASTPQPTPAPAPPPQPAPSSGPPTAFWVLGGAGVAAVAVGAVFEIMGLSQKSDLEACKPRCSPDDADAMTRNFVIGDIALVSGGVALGAALVVLLTDDDTPASTTGRLAPVIVASPWGGFAGLSTSF